MIIEAQNHNKKIVQVGMQQRSMPHIQKARELIKAGRIGQVFKVHLSWNRGGSEPFSAQGLRSRPAEGRLEGFPGQCARPAV